MRLCIGVVVLGGTAAARWYVTMVVSALSDAVLCASSQQVVGLPHNAVL